MSGKSDVRDSNPRNRSAQTEANEYDREKFCTEEYSVIQDGEYKYIGRPDDPQLCELPDEQTNHFDNESERAEEMAAWLEEWLETEGQPVGRGAEAEVDEEMRSRLADLGYLDHEM